MPTGKSDLVIVRADIEHETEKAYLVKSGSDKEAWLPKSQVEATHVKGATYDFEMPHWLAYNKELLDDAEAM